MRRFLRVPLIAAAVWAMGTLEPATAMACGGFFCNRAQPVNQAAEGIIFADNGDGTTTAVIQIQYQGPAQNFSWLLPISSVPKSDSDIGVASNVALQRLQSATNPQYTLTTRIEGSCREADDDGGCGVKSGSSRTFAGRGPSAVDPSNTGVVVEATGVVGAFQWSVISLDQTLVDPASLAVQWLKDNGYDVPSSAPALLGPYLKAGLHLLALRLTKGADTGSIRPIMLTYAGAQPSIPVKLTAVAANDDMGVLTWVLGKSRAVPINYLSLELNEARLDWLNGAFNYNAVVSEAANDAGGQGFVTEFAGDTKSLAGAVWTSRDQSDWSALKQAVDLLGERQLIQEAQRLFGAWDGFWDATRAAVTLPGGISFDAFKVCLTCYTIQLSPTDYLEQLEKLVIEPVRRVQHLVDAHPEITRLYTTLSADEMTLDPLFGFNPGLQYVNNVHVAERVIECNPIVDLSDAPWHVELPQGGAVAGKGSNWPTELAALPPNRVITRSAESGEGKVIEDNAEAIQSELARLEASRSAAADAGGGCTTGRARARGVWLAVTALAAALLVRRRRRA